MNFTEDPIVNAIYSGIKRGITVAFKNKCYGSAVILIYAGIDAMAHLDMPAKHLEVQPKDFMKWVEKYLVIDASQKITAEEFYSARCAVLHTYGVKSRKVHVGKCRMIGYMVGGYPPIRYNPTVSNSLVLLEIGAFKHAFFEALDKFLITSFANGKKRKIMEPRLEWLLTVIPFNKEGKTSA